MVSTMALGGQAGPAESDEKWLRRELSAQLIREQPFAIAGQLVLVIAVLAFLWPVAPESLLIIWGVVLLAATGVRSVAWRKRRSVATAVVGVGVAWGAGAAVLVPHLGTDYLALLLLVLAGLVAAAVATLSASTFTFRLFLFAVLGPLPVTMLANGHGRFVVMAAFLIMSYGAFAVTLHGRMHQSLVDRLRVSESLRRREAESARQRTFLDMLFTKVPNAVVVVDDAGRCLISNPGFQSLFGYAPEEVVGRVLVDLIVAEPDRAEALNRQKQVRAGDTVIFESDRTCKDGRVITVQISTARMVIGEEQMVLFLYTEITAIRRTEAALRAARARLEQVLASSTAVIYANRIEGAIFLPSWVSENITRITGYEVAEALDPVWWVTRMHPDDQPKVFAGLRRLLSEGHLTTEYRFRQKNGEYRWMHDESRLTVDAAGKPLEIFGAWLDITDRKLAEEAVSAARDLAERAARTQAAFLANMSHEIRTPMNAVLGLTELMLDTELSSYQRRSMGMVRSAGEVLLTLLNDILDFSKIEAEQLTVESISFDPRSLVEATMALLAVRMEGRKIELVADVASGVPRLLCGDPSRLRQVLTNLVGNAIKFTNVGEVVLSATSTPAAEGKVNVRFAVRDSGIGIPAGQLAAIFDEFVQADPSMTRKYGGTGLGLAISKRLVALMGGQLTVTSEEGKGSEFAFTITLPIESAPAAPEPNASRLSGRRMLVIDDNATNRRIVREILTSALVAVDEAPDADRGLEMIRAAQREGTPYSVAVTDVHMPGRDGFALAAAVRGDPALAATRILLLTSSGQSGDTERCAEVGIEGYLTKPVSRTDLLEMAATLLGQPPGAEPTTRSTIADSRRLLHILLAEDNAVNQEVAATMLRKRGHTVDVVSNGLEAVKAVAATSYDVVLMDIQMPEMDGFAATKVIRATPGGADLPIIALTAHALSGERERCLANGLNGYIPKPFSPHELFAVVEGFGEAPRLLKAAGEVVAPTIDLDGFRRAMRDAGAEDAVDGILAIFAQQVPERMAALVAAVDAADPLGISRAAHAFRSPAAAIGAVSLAGVLKEIELAGRDGAVDRARAGYGRVRGEVDAVLVELKASR